MLDAYLTQRHQMCTVHERHRRKKESKETIKYSSYPVPVDDFPTCRMGLAAGILMGKALNVKHVAAHSEQVGDSSIADHFYSFKASSEGVD